MKLKNDRAVYEQVAELHQRNPQREYVVLDSLDNFRCLHNNVLIRINPSIFERVGNIVLGDEGFLDSQNRYHPAVHAVRFGYVVKHPKEFRYDENGIQGHKTNIEIQEGDIVYFPIVESMNCPLFLHGGNYYLYMNYEVLYLAKRRIDSIDSDINTISVNGENFLVIMLNGYLLCERVYDKDSNPLRIDDGNVLVKKHALVKFSGTPVEYRQIKSMTIYSTKKNCNGYTDARYIPTNKEIRNGDLVLISKINQQAEVLLEDQLHLHFDGKNLYRLVQRKYVDAILNR